MNISLKLTSYSDGETNNKYWIRLYGETLAGKRIQASAFGPVAQALVQKLKEIIPVGETVQSYNLFVDLTGDERDRTPYTDDKGNTHTGKFFKIDEFFVPVGPSLELARMRRNAAKALETLSKFSSSRDALEHAAEALSAVAGVAFDPQAIAFVDEHELDSTAHDPEEEALRRYEESDRASGLSEAVHEAGPIDAVKNADDMIVEERDEATDNASDLSEEPEISDEEEIVGPTDSQDSALELEALDRADEVDDVLALGNDDGSDDEPQFDDDPQFDDEPHFDDDVSHEEDTPAPVRFAGNQAQTGAPAVSSRPTMPARGPAPTLRSPSGVAKPSQPTSPAASSVAPASPATPSSAINRPAPSRPGFPLPPSGGSRPPFPGR